MVPSWLKRTLDLSLQAQIRAFKAWVSTKECDNVNFFRSELEGWFTSATVEAECGRFGVEYTIKYPKTTNSKKNLE